MFDTSFTAQGNSATASISGTPSFSGEIAIAAICVGGSNTITGVPVGWNMLYRTPNTFGASEQLYYQILSGSGSVSASVGLSASSPWSMSLSFFSFGGFVSANVTQVQVDGADTVTVTCANNFVPGNIVLMQGLTNATFLNGQILLVLTASSSQFTAGFVHAAYGPTSDSGTATKTVQQVTNNVQGGDSSPDTIPFNNNVQANSIFAFLLYSTQSGTIAFTGGSDTNGNSYSLVSSSEANATVLAAFSSPNKIAGNMPSTTVSFSPSLIGNTDRYVLELVPSFGVGLPVVPVPPAQAGTPNNPGRAIQFFGVSPANPAVVSTPSNSAQLFTFDTTSTGGVRVLWRYPDDGNHLGRIAMPGQLLVLPGTGYFRGTQYFVAASGTITIPPSATNSGVSFTMFQNNFLNLTPNSGLNIQITSLPLVTLPNFALKANTNSYQWNFIGSLSGAGNSVGVAGTWNINGTQIGVSGSAIATADEQPSGSKVQLSLSCQFAGSVQGSDAFQATLSQFEIEEI